VAGRRSRQAKKLPAGLREQLAQEAARIMIEQGIGDFGLAKRKAAERLGATTAGMLPSNAQVEASVIERQRIFAPGAHDSRLAALRELAAEVMAELEPFRPRLVGPVLAGTATANAAVELHAFADAPETVAAFLEQGAQRTLRDSGRRYRFAKDESVEIPGFAFTRDGIDVEVFVFPERRAHHAPLSPVDQRPMRRASRGAVLELLNAAAGR
jgi:hypothetical protein